jgi:leucyl-tRNA synthetase
MHTYDHSRIEKHWQSFWRTSATYRTSLDSGKPKCYILDMFPYPSGEGLHVGHPKGYIATDVYSRMKRMQGYAVLHPMGWDAFGLPAEQYALKNKVHPKAAVEKNIARYKDQLEQIGFDYDWDRELNTTDPAYYRHTQWIFKQLFKKGLAYESHEPINWCPSCKTGLSNEDLDGGACERCGTKVEKKPLRQWVLRITAYADRMLQDLDALNWPEHIKESQRNWIGRSEGAEITFPLRVPGQDDGAHSVTIFTTRPDTLYGATYIAISAELAELWISKGWNPGSAVRACIDELRAEEKERAFDLSDVVEKKGIATGVMAIHPATGKEIPVWIANYVLSGYGTGAIMAVPAHDTRDFDFARQHQIPILHVIDPCVEHPDAVGKGDREAKRKVVALVEHEGRYLSIQWKPELGGNLFLGGTIEGNDDIASTILRELKEETGYTDATIVDVASEVFHYDYFAYSKGKAFSADIHLAHVKLNSLKQEVAMLESDEEGKFEVVWLSKNEAMRVANPPHARVFAKYVLNEPFTGTGRLVDSGTHTGLTSHLAMRAITEAVGGTQTTQYRLKEWVFARQRYWGEPFPVVFDSTHTAHVVADSELPIMLPMVDAYEPTDTGESPLANISDWVNVYGHLNSDGEFESLPKDDPRAKHFTRETNTMPQWAGSSWYYLRYIDPKNPSALVNSALEKEWSPVDFYVGGAEHATRHLIYARFWHKFLFDIGVVSHPEPFLRLQNVGLIMASDGRKMSKRWGNVINPDTIVERFGADSLRVYEMFMGPFGQAIAWNEDNLVGARRFLERVWRISSRVSNDAMESEELTVLRHRTIKKVSEDIELFAFNTAIAQMMTYLNLLEKSESLSRQTYLEFLTLLAPFAPHMTEELWHTLTPDSSSIHLSLWPKWDESKTVLRTRTIGVQVNGKLRATISIDADAEADVVENAALAHPDIVKWLSGSTPKKVIVVAGKIVSIVV